MRTISMNDAELGNAKQGRLHDARGLSTLSVLPLDSATLNK